MKNFQNYFYEANKLFEFRIKIANCDVTNKEILESIKNAIDAYQIETISEPKRLPIQEHKDFGNLGPCECYVIDVAVKYPTIVEQIRQLVISRAQLNADCVCVYTKNQAENLDMVQERIDVQGAVIGTELDNNPKAESGQELVGQVRIGSFLKELETRKYEFAAASEATGKTTADLPQGTTSPVGTKQNTVYKAR